MSLAALQRDSSEDRVVDWILRAAVAVFFLLVGLDKFSHNPRSEWVVIFQKIGFGTWFRYFTGVIEVAGGVLFLWPRVTLIGAGLLLASMAGAVVAHFVYLGDPGASVIPLALGVGIALVTVRVRRAA